MLPPDAPKLDKQLLKHCLLLVQSLHDSEQRKPKIPAPNSRRLMIVPDPTESLKIGEVYFNLSRINEDDDHGVITGDILMCRNPIYHASHNLVFKAVANEQLDSMMLKDLLIMNVDPQGPSLDELCGADFDGDHFEVFWDKRMLENRKDWEEYLNKNRPNWKAIEKMPNAAFMPDEYTSRLYKLRSAAKEINIGQSKHGSTWVLAHNCLSMYGPLHPELQSLNKAQYYLVDSHKNPTEAVRVMEIPSDPPYKYHMPVRSQPRFSDGTCKNYIDSGLINRALLFVNEFHNMLTNSTKKEKQNLMKDMWFDVEMFKDVVKKVEKIVGKAWNSNSDDLILMSEAQEVIDEIGREKLPLDDVNIITALERDDKFNSLGLTGKFNEYIKAILKKIDELGNLTDKEKDKIRCTASAAYQRVGRGEERDFLNLRHSIQNFQNFERYFFVIQLLQMAKISHSNSSGFFEILYNELETIVHILFLDETSSCASSVLSCTYCHPMWL
eukprot:GHVL01017495.1.p1 GENE.GHVL01017495.1~~GHVL01017495.1.p1  ORF type:complete len:497 (+),score=76.70 GHVL01017495.1:1044-2534(+)